MWQRGGNGTVMSVEHLRLICRVGRSVIVQGSSDVCVCEDTRGIEVLHR